MLIIFLFLQIIKNLIQHRVDLSFVLFRINILVGVCQKNLLTSHQYYLNRLCSNLQDVELGLLSLDLIKVVQLEPIFLNDFHRNKEPLHLVIYQIQNFSSLLQLKFNYF